MKVREKLDFALAWSDSLLQKEDDSDTSTSSDHSILSSSSSSDTLSSESFLFYSTMIVNFIELDHEKLIELCDTNRTCKLKVILYSSSSLRLVFVFL